MDERARSRRHNTESYPLDSAMPPLLQRSSGHVAVNAYLGITPEPEGFLYSSLKEQKIFSPYSATIDR